MSRASRHRSSSARVRVGEAARLVAVLFAVALAPTVGNIGTCGESPEDLDALKFFGQKAQIDCARCDECGIDSRACDAACDGPQSTEFPRGCYPLVHDGRVCLNALAAASCADYRDYTADEGATTPTECNFCPPEDAP